VKKFLAALALVGLLIAGLFVPSGDSLEFHTVDDLVYTMDGFQIDLHPPPVRVQLEITGMELADQLRWLVPGSDRTVQFGNGRIIVRATTVRHLAVRAAIAARRLRNETCQSIAVGIYHLKTTLPKKLFGMITA
jgi:hypothetical protein